MKKLLSFCLSLLAAGCATIPKNTTQKTTEIQVGPGPEDFVLDTSFAYPRLLVSCAERRKKKEAYDEIVEVNLETKATRILPRDNSPEMKFHPHGIDLQTVDGKPYLYVISHDDSLNRQVIYKYLVEQDRLVFEDTIINPKYLISPNDLAVAPSGEIYWSNDASKRNGQLEQLFKIKRSTIGYYNPNTDEWRIAADKMVYCNGVAIRGDKVYVSTTRSNRIFEFDKDANGYLSENRVLCKIKGLDNMTFYGNHIIITSHPRLLAFIRHYKKSKNRSPSLVHKVELDSGKVTTIFANDGSKINAASTGLVFENKLYIAQVFDPFILEVELE